jgi:hypothetical protein
VNMMSGRGMGERDNLCGDRCLHVSSTEVPLVAIPFLVAGTHDMYGT